MNIARRLAVLAVLVVLGSVAVVPSRAQDNSRPAAPAPVTYQGLIAMLRSGASEAEILDRLRKSPVDVSFTLGTGQVEELKKMRVSDEFIGALRDLVARGATQALAGSDITDFVLILDCSGSMMEFTPDQKSKMDVAKVAMADLIQKIPNGLRVAFIVYGHNREQACNAVQVLRGLDTIDDAGKSALSRAISGLRPVGNTPIALALRTAGEELSKSQGLSKLVLITDGVETCNGDPAREAAALAKALKLRDGVEVIGLGLKPEERKAVEAIARAGNGKYLGADSAKELTKALIAVRPAAPEQRKSRGPEFAGQSAKPGTFLNNAPLVPAGEYKGTLAMMAAHYYRTPVRAGQELRVVGQVQKAPYQAMNQVNNQTFTITIYDASLEVVAREKVEVKDTPTALQTLRATWAPKTSGVAYVAIAASDNHDGPGSPASLYPENTVPRPSPYTLRIRVEGAGAGEPPAPIAVASSQAGAGFAQAGELAIPSMAADDLKLGEVAFYRTSVTKGETLQVSAAAQKPWYRASNGSIEATYTLTVYDDDQVQVAQRKLEVPMNPPDAQTLVLTWPVAMSGQAYISVSCENSGQDVYPETFQPKPGFLTVQVARAPGGE
jgi:Mg-chelatase subunit ChlD